MIYALEILITNTKGIDGKHNTNIRTFSSQNGWYLVLHSSTKEQISTK